MGAMTHPGPHRANPLKAAFDFSFTSYATPGLVKIIYLLAVIITAAGWLGALIGAVVLGSGTAATYARYSEPSGLETTLFRLLYPALVLLFGWIPGLLSLLFLRVVLEAASALVRSAEDVRVMRAVLERAGV